MSEQPGPTPNPYHPQQHGAMPPWGPGGAPWGPPPDHPQTNTVLILGILGLVVCQVCAPFAWVIGNRAQREIDASGGRLGGRQSVQIGRILGMIGTAILGLSLLLVVGYVILVVVLLGASVSAGA